MHRDASLLLSMQKATPTVIPGAQRGTSLLVPITIKHSFPSLAQLLCEGMFCSQPLVTERHHFGFDLLDERLAIYFIQDVDEVIEVLGDTRMLLLVYTQSHAQGLVVVSIPLALFTESFQIMPSGSIVGKD